MKTKSTRSNHAAVTLVEVLVVVATLALLVAIIVPALKPAKASVSPFHCVNFLQQVGLGFRMWANDNREKFPWHVSTNEGGTMELVGTGEAWRHFVAASNELNSPKILRCPTDMSRTRASTWSNFGNQNLSYFVGLEADETKPNTILSGDRNLMTNGVALKPGLVVLSTNSVPGYTTELHNGAGNFALGDGSAQQVNPAALARQFIAGGTNVIRLLIP